MIDTKKVKEYIENKNHIELTPIQYKILKAIIRGDEVYTARGVGRSTLYNGYADYLKNVLGKDTNRDIAPDDFDSIFTASMMLNDSYFQEHKIADTFERIKKASPDRFNCEYECIYDIPIKKGTYMLAKNIKKDDIFIYNGCENVAIDDYLDNSSYLWVTSRERWKPEGVNCVYNYTSAMVIELKPNEEVEYVGRMK